MFAGKARAYPSEAPYPQKFILGNFRICSRVPNWKGFVIELGMLRPIFTPDITNLGNNVKKHFTVVIYECLQKDRIEYLSPAVHFSLI
jgi:hypothetical protein